MLCAWEVRAAFAGGSHPQASAAGSPVDGSCGGKLHVCGVSLCPLLRGAQGLCRRIWPSVLVGLAVFARYSDALLSEQTWLPSARAVRR